MTNRLKLTLAAVIVTAILVILGSLSATAQKPQQLELQFFTFLQAGMHEQDVFIDKTLHSLVYRVTASDQDMSAPLYTSASPVAHNPVDPSDVGPFPRGRPLGVTLGEWLEAKGSGVITCNGDQGSFTGNFEKLVPGGVYTIWYFFMAMPASIPFSTYDLPLGARDGTENIFVADAEGNASIEVSLEPCLQLSGEQLVAGLALAYHSDGKTYGGDPGTFGDISHLHLLVFLPSAVEVAASR